MVFGLYMDFLGTKLYDNPLVWYITTYAHKYFQE